MKIYFDMDGVLADFDRGIRELCGLEPMDQGAHDPEREDNMFAMMGRVGHFYAKLAPYEDMLALLRDALSALGPDGVAILTGVPKPRRGIPEAADDKRDWIRRHVAAPIEVHTVYRRDKAGFAGSKSHILIDDFAPTIQEWEAAGGTGIHHTSAAATRARLVALGAL